MKNIKIFVRMTRDNNPHDVGINEANVLEITPYGDNTPTSWVKYWDGKEVRSMVVVGTVSDIVNGVNTNLGDIK